MPGTQIGRWSLLAAIGTFGVLAGFLSQMDPLAVRPVQAGEVSASSSAKATSRSSSSADSSAGRCQSRTSAGAEATTVVDGETRTVRREDADRSDACGGRAESEAKAAVDGTQSGNGESEP